jgi:hypothetical protein
MIDVDTPSFIKVKGDSYVFANEGTFKFYVPEKYFSNKLAQFVGEYISLFGMLSYAIVDKNDKAIGKLRTFKFPISFLTKPDEIEVVKGITLTSNNNPSDYRILKYHKDGVIVVNYNIAEDAENIQRWYSALDTGALPNNLPYDELQDYFLRNIQLTGNKYSVSLQLIGVVIGELCRSRKDIDTAFRLTDSNDMNNYQWISIRDIPKGVSPFTALQSEEWDKAVISSIIADTNRDSPLEKIMMD